MISSLDTAAREERGAIIKIVIFTLGVLLVIGFILWIVIGFITKPLTDYIGNFKAAATGNLTVRAHTTSTQTR